MSISTGDQTATPSLTSAIVDSSTKLSFRKVGEEVEKYTAGVISSSDEEKRQHKLWYEDGLIPPSGRRKASILYIYYIWKQMVYGLGYNEKAKIIMS